MIPFEEAVSGLLRRMGLPDPSVMDTIASEWASVAGEPWASQARPLYVRSGVLVVEATAPGAVGFLKYGVADLRRRLGERFGSDVITDVEIRTPTRPRRGGR